jgi:3-dehydroquinate dehydratase II
MRISFRPKFIKIAVFSGLHKPDNVLYIINFFLFKFKAMTISILVLNGPNLNLLGSREPEIYGGETLSDIETACQSRAAQQDAEVTFRQSNAEGDLVDWIQQAAKDYDGLIINAAAYTHTSVAVLDALLAASLPIIEVHLSNIHQRESFRHASYVSQAAHGMVCGFGGFGYEMAVDAVVRMVTGERRGK